MIRVCNWDVESRATVDMTVVGAPECWRPVVGRPGYDVSDQGRVRSNDRTVQAVANIVYTSYRKGRFLKSWPDSTGHLVVGVGSRVRRHIHVLVLHAFCGPPPAPKMQARHRNGNPADNKLTNLEWSTKSRNHQDIKHHAGQRNYKLNGNQVAEIKRALLTGKSGKLLAIQYGVSGPTISAIKHNRLHTDVEI